MGIFSCRGVRLPARLLELENWSFKSVPIGTKEFATSNECFDTGNHAESKEMDEIGIIEQSR